MENIKTRMGQKGYPVSMELLSLWLDRKMEELRPGVSARAMGEGLVK